MSKEMVELGERQKGYYEPLLCKDCEGFFNDNFEKPCIDFFRGIPDHVVIGSNYRVKPPKQLGLLMLAIIWRASHALGEQWDGIDLGPHQEVIRTCLEERVPKPEYGFWLFFSSMPDGELMKGVVTPLQRVKMQGHNMYHFIAGGMQFITKISSHRFANINPPPMDFSKEVLIEAADVREAPSMRLIFKNTK